MRHYIFLATGAWACCIHHPAMSECNLHRTESSALTRDSTSRERRPFRPEENTNGVPRWWSRGETPPLESVHSVYKISLNEGLLEFEDGSQWLIDDGSLYEMRNLIYGDRITFRQSRSWFSKCPFEIVVLRSGRYLQASPYQGPLLSSPYLRTLVSASLENGLIELSDGTVWEIDPTNHSGENLQTWAFNDIMMLGQHVSGWWATNHPVLLFNCGANNWIAVRRIR